jgi:hypothetical protein
MMGRIKVHMAMMLVGVTIALFGYLFGLWSGVLSGLDISIKIMREWSQRLPAGIMSIPGDIPIQTTIFFIIAGIGLVLLAQLIILLPILRGQRIFWGYIETILSTLGVILLAVLILKYSASTSGIIITFVGGLLILAGDVMLLYQELPFRLSDRTRAKKIISLRWHEKLSLAERGKVMFAVISIQAAKYLKTSQVDYLNNELRGDDAIFPVRDGAYVQVWNVNQNGAYAVANHIQDSLQIHYEVESKIGIACYPEDGQSLEELAAYADSALH